MIKTNDFNKGWKYAISLQSYQISSAVGKSYIDKVIHEIENLSEQINSYAGSKQNNAVLGGFIAEEFHAGTYNIKAVAADSTNRAFVERSNGQASVDISTNFGNDYSLKYLKFPDHSIKAQSKNVLQNYHEYVSSAKTRGTKNPLSLEEYLNKYGYNDDLASLLTSVYNGQGRIIPADQLDEGIEKLKRLIATESFRDGENRVYNLQNYEETLLNLSDRIRSYDGVESIPLTKEEAEKIAELCKNNNFKPEDFGISLDEIITTQYALNQSLKGGINAATLSFAIQIIPDVMTLIYDLTKNKEIDICSIKKHGYDCISTTAKSFVVGFLTCNIFLSCKLGRFGSRFTSVQAPIVGSIVAISMNIIKESFNYAVGKTTTEQLRYHLTQNLIITCSSLICGGIAVSLLPVLNGIAFSIGSMIGSITASVITNLGEKVLISLCVNTGYTLFGLVKQNYTLPVNVLKQLGLNIKEIDRINVDYSSINRNNVDRKGVDYNAVKRVEIKMVKRGIISLRTIGYKW